MGQFKPMVKMMTTEPTVELKLKKGGKVSKMADGGYMPMQSGMTSPMPSSMPARGGMMPTDSPARPSMARRRKAMMASKPAMAMPAPAMPAMKKGGSMKHEDAAQDRAMIKKAMSGKKFATGGVVEAQGGYKKGGLAVASNGIIMSKSGKTKMDTAERNTKTSGKTGDVGLNKPAGYKAGGGVKGGGVNGNVSSTPAGVTNMTTGSVKLGNAGGFKKGGTAKKYARGGAVVQDDGGAQSMPQGRKKPSPPVSITALSGTFKKGGRVKKMAEGGESTYAKDIANNSVDPKVITDKASRELEEALNPISMVKEAYTKAKNYITGKPTDVKNTTVVTSEKVKKHGGSVKC
jgi:hypothetical protein